MDLGPEGCSGGGRERSESRVGLVPRRGHGGRNGSGLPPERHPWRPARVAEARAALARPLEPAGGATTLQAAAEDPSQGGRPSASHGARTPAGRGGRAAPGAAALPERGSPAASPRPLEVPRLRRAGDGVHRQQDPDRRRKAQPEGLARRGHEVPLPLRPHRLRLPRALHSARGEAALRGREERSRQRQRCRVWGLGGGPGGDGRGSGGGLRGQHLRRPGRGEQGGLSTGGLGRWHCRWRHPAGRLPRRSGVFRGAAAVHLAHLARCRHGPDRLLLVHQSLRVDRPGRRPEAVVGDPGPPPGHLLPGRPDVCLLQAGVLGRRRRRRRR
mmetsp:Transcript_39711/g.123762  ORF Transcript_39711/g.123762 Transcript_39711/m.123762 type:complete len:328 (+) Transcript_39711:1639-2622(+)